MSLLMTACHLRSGASRAAARLAVGRAQRAFASGPVMGGTWEDNGYEVSPHNGAPKIESPWHKWFPYEPMPFSPKLSPYRVYCNAGDTYWVCSCGECTTQPFVEKDACKNGFEPVLFIPRTTGTKFIHGSKHQTHPIFNGTDWIVWADVNMLPALGISFAACFVGSFALTAFFHP